MNRTHILIHQVRHIGLGIMLLAAPGCGEVRDPVDSVGPSYTGAVKAILDARCARCHQGTSPSGGYDLSTYQGILGPGSDLVRNAVPKDSSSRLLTKLDSQKEAAHWGYLLPGSSELSAGESAEERREADLALLTAWVVQSKLAYASSSVHPPSWAYPGDRSSESFHGGALRAARWDATACKQCHGAALTGGPQGGPSCMSCHANGVMSCTTCHGSTAAGGSVAPPADLSWKLEPTARGVGAHAAHLKSLTWFAPVTCTECHKMPASVTSPGHLFDDENTRTSDLRAEFTPGPTASLGKVTAAYDTTALTCKVYCHGASLKDPGKASNPIWTAAAGSTGCDSCHAAPHKSPAYGGGNADCSLCHQQAVKRCTTAGASGCIQVASGVNLEFLSAARHGDGKVLLGAAGADGTCWGCHGTQASKGAPGPDLNGSSDTSKITVGLHATHLASAGKFASGVTCADCHTVPATITAAGHLDSDQPAEVTFSDLARGKARSSTVDLKPAFDAKTGVCSNVYCHSLSGAGTTQWTWNKAATPPLGCGSCHGSPPQKTVTGVTHSTSKMCNTCHKSAFTSNGDLDPTKHINGKVDL